MSEAIKKEHAYTYTHLTDNIVDQILTSTCDELDEVYTGIHVYDFDVPYTYMR